MSTLQEPSREDSQADWDAVLNGELGDEDYPYCQCDLDPIEEEAAFNVCSCCGKPLQ